MTEHICAKCVHQSYNVCQNCEEYELKKCRNLFRCKAYSRCMPEFCQRFQSKEPPQQPVWHRGDKPEESGAYWIMASSVNVGALEYDADKHSWHKFGARGRAYILEPIVAYARFSPPPVDIETGTCAICEHSVSVHICSTIGEKWMCFKNESAQCDVLPTNSCKDFRHRKTSEDKR